MIWKKYGESYISDDYVIVVAELPLPTVGLSASPRRWFDAVLTYRGGEVSRTRASRTRAVSDMKAIAEHHNRPMADCPSRCTNHRI